MTYIPSSTYRLQLSHKFTLTDAAKQLNYLLNLGISTIYAAPFFKARAGSEHGYDITEAHTIGSAIGTVEELENLARQLQEKGMGWLQDIVPNHMAFSTENTWLMDVLEKGQKSDYLRFFDIDLSHPEFNGQLMVPFLGQQLQDIIEKKELKITISQNGFRISYFDSHYPASLPVYEQLLRLLISEAGPGSFSDQIQDLTSQILLAISQEDLDTEMWKQLKENLQTTITKHSELKQSLERVLDEINSTPEKLNQLLDIQYYRLCHWQETEKRINYRRFFTVNELICLGMERPGVFTRYHEFIKHLCDKKLVQGLRVDHVDGLFDPDTYLERLRELAGEHAYLVVEKILEGEENLPETWPVQGNSGYDFLAWVSNLFTDARGEEKLTNVYRRLVPDAATDYDKLVFEKKLYILENQMPGELNNLLRLLNNAELVPAADKERVRQALAVLLASFPVYRVYVRQLPLSEKAERIVSEAFAEANKRAPEYKTELQLLQDLFRPNAQDSEEKKHARLYFVMRSQQFTGPLAAKGIEDTTFYNYNRLLALNEVGNSPAVFNLTPSQFHERMQYKLQTYPHSINATATHDTKRGEDARTRLQVLSELPDEWETTAQQWIRIARQKAAAGKPTDNELYFMLQTLLGVMPPNGKTDDQLVERVQAFFEKAFREAKANTNWSEPNAEYEKEVKELVGFLLKNNKEFTSAFQPFFEKLAFYGFLYSLCQTTLKLTCPGVPDVYQGCELWDFSLVDPDNRRPVDYDLRQQYLSYLKHKDQQNPQDLHQEILTNFVDGKVKLYLIWKLLQERQRRLQLFSLGNYLPLTATGKATENVLAFARKYNHEWAIVLVPRLLTNLVKPQALPLSEKVWQDTSILLPDGAPANWRNVFDNSLISGNGSLRVSTIFSSFPVAFLVAE